MLHAMIPQCQDRIRHVFHRALIGQKRCATNLFFRNGGPKKQLQSLNQRSVIKRKNSHASMVCIALSKGSSSWETINYEEIISTERNRSSLQVSEVNSNTLPETYNLPVYTPDDEESAESFIKLPLKCRGCGAFIQNQDPMVKGYILPKKLPSLLRKGSLEDLICSNCYSLRYANKALTLGINKENVLWQLKPLRDSKAMILYVVDIMDMNGSIMPEFMELIGENKTIIIVGNKLDMLSSDDVDKPRRQENYVAEVLRRCCIDEGLDEKIIKDVCLVSGVTGYGFEKLVVLINKYRDIDMNLYVMGSSNVGKSTIFNMLQNLAAISKDADVPTQAITHRIPYSTTGLVRSPFAYWRMKKVRKMLLEKPVEPEEQETFEFIDDIIKDIKPSKVLQTTEASSDETALERILDYELSQDVDLHSLEKERRWIYDTPSLLNTQQITQFLTPPELKFLQHKLWVVPKTYLMIPGRSLLLGGLARIDYCEITRKSLSDPSQYEEVRKGAKSIFFTVFCSHNIPIHPTETVKASQVYENNFGNHILKVPFGDDDRRKEFPKLQPKGYELTGVGWQESCADLAIAGIGWISISAGKGSIIKLDLHTPNGIGQTQRNQCLMPYSVNKRGERGVKYAGVYSRYIYQGTRKNNPQLVGSFEKQNEIMKAWLGKINKKQKYQRFEIKQERRRLLLEQGVTGQIRKYEEKLALIESEAAKIRALEAGTAKLCDE